MVWSEFTRNIWLGQSFLNVYGSQLIVQPQLAVSLPSMLFLPIHQLTSSSTVKIESIPTIIIAFIILLYLPSFPFSAKFLTAREKAIAQARVQRDHQPTSHGGMGGWKGFKRVLLDTKCWGFAVIYCGCEYPLLRKYLASLTFIIVVSVHASDSLCMFDCCC